jgi:hypothetical protein
MRRCAFVAAAMLFVGLSARADYLYVRIDLSQAYQYIPSMPGGIGVAPVGPVGGRGPVGRGPGPGNYVPGPRPPIAGQFPGQPDIALKPPAPGEGPFVEAIFEIKSKLGFDGPPQAKDPTQPAAPKPAKGEKKKTPELGAHLFDHEFGKNGRFIVSQELTAGGVIKYQVIERPSPSTEFIRLFRKDLAKGTDPKRFVPAATWALQHGLLKEFHATMEEYAKVEPKSPIAINYRRVAEGLKKAPAGNDPSLRGLVNELTNVSAVKYHSVAGDSAYYLGLSNLPTDFDDGVKRRLKLLHDTMERFYYWFALNPKLPQPELPKSRQLLVVTNSIDEFYIKHAEWGSMPFAGEGVTPRPDNFILNSWRPIDDSYRVFDQTNQDMLKKLQLPKDWLITGKVWDKDQIPSTIAIDPFQVAFAQTVALVQRSMEDDAEIATLTREGARQLLFASGMIPRHVHVPEWIVSGLSGFFATSGVMPYPTVGLPHASNLVALNYYRATKQLGKSGDVLANVIDDRYFRTAHRALLETADAENADKLAERARIQTELGNSTAWALVYYLIERRRDPMGLFRYCQELNALPRDLDLDEQVLEGLFARAFNLGQANDPSKLDAAKTAAFANGWFSELSGITLENPEIQFEMLETRRLAAKKSANN